jgi:hypothetical protein
MSDDEINVAMADAMGWRKEDGVYVWTANGIDCTCDELWDWANDLNAMHLAEKTLNMQQWRIYLMHLASFMQDICHATAKEKAKAYLKTLGEWKEAQP